LNKSKNMKNFKTKFLGLALAGLILGACSQTGTYETADLMNEQATAANKAGFKLTPFGSGNENAAILAGGGDCETDCIDENSGDLFAATATSPTVSCGGPNQNNDSKSLSVKVWNTLTTIEYEFTINTTANSAGKLQYYDEGTMAWVDYPMGALTNNVAFPVSWPLGTWAACDVVTEQWRQEGGGPPVSLGDVSYNLIGECVDCVDEMTADLTCGETNSITFTFTAVEAGPIVIQGGLNANAVITASGSNVLTQNTSHPSLDNSNASVTRWEGNVDACQEVTVTVSWTGPASIGDWSAKRGDVTLGFVDKTTVVCD
jgi:hypothetical protein